MSQLFSAEAIPKDGCQLITFQVARWQHNTAAMKRYYLEVAETLSTYISLSRTPRAATIAAKSAGKYSPRMEAICSAMKGKEGESGHWGTIARGKENHCFSLFPLLTILNQKLFYRRSYPQSPEAERELKMGQELRGDVLSNDDYTKLS